MNINGEEFEFDISDINDAKRYSEALEKYQEKVKEIKEAEGVAVMERGVAAIRDFLYEATGHDVIYNCTSFRKAVGAFKSFLDQIESQKAEMDELFADIGKKAEMIGAEKPEYPATYQGMGGVKRPSMVK